MACPRHDTTLADPEFTPRSLRIKIALSAPDYMKDSTTFTSEEEGLQNDLKIFQDKVKARFATMGQATITSLTSRLQVQFVKNLKELAKICFFPLLTLDLDLSKTKSTHMRKQV
mmetsp:Transcript_36713/g.51895  ORF Transcript_36713/g.51895 Transcript_36713/m.51895 type:complete len:114 (-) Transcript_36713:1658-1999(-)